jgi:hypothetical protein
VGVRLVDHHAAARVDGDVAGKEHGVTRLLLPGGGPWPGRAAPAGPWCSPVPGHPYRR